MIVFDGILKLKYFPCFKRSLYILIFWAVIFLSNDYYASRQIHERNLKINEIYNSIDKGMDSGDYRSVYEILESRLLPRQSPVDSIIFESHSARYYSPEFYVRSKMIEFIKNEESSKVIDFLNLGKGKLRYFEIGPEAWYLAVNNNDFNFFGFYLDYWNWIDLKKAKPISALTGSRPYLLGGNKYTDYYSVSRFYGKLLSIGNMSMIREYEDFFIENEKGDFFNDAINRYRKEDDAPILISGSLISNVLKSGEVDVLKHAVKLGLVKLYPFMISYYIAEYPKTKPVLIYILDQLGGALENKGLAPRSLFSIIESINYRTSYKHPNSTLNCDICNFKPPTPFC